MTRKARDRADLRKFYDACAFPKTSGKRKAKPQPIRRQNPARTSERRGRQFGEGEREKQVIAMLPCSACGRYPPSEPSHVVTCGAGGTVLDLVPHCPTCHLKFHQWGRETFAERMRQDLNDVAARYAFLVSCLLAGGVLDRPGVDVEGILSTLRFGS